jgi:CubicO group peptidase (beta-lactamase class C family)
MPQAKAMQKYIFDPMDLKQTRSFDTPQIPEPVLHAFSSERRADPGVPPGSHFYEESTFWNPSWANRRRSEDRVARVLLVALVVESAGAVGGNNGHRKPLRWGR